MSPETLAQVLEVHEALEPFADFVEWNAPYQIAFTCRCREQGKPLAELTVADLQALARQTREDMKDYFYPRSHP